MDTRGETTVEIRAALLHHRSHLPRNHIYHVIRIPCAIISVSLANHITNTFNCKRIYCVSLYAFDGKPPDDR